jgi:non-ribosomal peptide synthetase component F
MTLLSVFQVLLYRYTGQKDIVVGSPIANRHYKEIEGLIGFFVNTLALRTTFEGNETFIDVLTRVKETTLQAYQHQDVPFEQLVDHLNITRALNRNPVFQVMVTLQNATKEEPLALKQLQTELFCSSYPIAKFDLSLSIYESEDTLEVGIEYATDLFEAETIGRMGVHFKELIEGIVSNPNQEVETLSLLTPQEQRQLLIEWNETNAPYPKDKTIHQLFEEQVNKTPHNIAIVYEDQELTYEQLNKRANQLAHHLRVFGVKPDTLVAIAMERSLEMIIGLLGILKAGGAYVPLDPSYPQDRLQFMLEDTKAPILITQAHLQEIFKEYAGTTLNIHLHPQTKELFVEELSRSEVSESETWISLSPSSIHNPEPLTTPHNLAYVIYTSGSTGKPKGVMIGHNNFIHYIIHAQKA